MSLYVLRRDSNCGASSTPSDPPPSGELRMRGVLIRRCGKSGKTNQGCVMVLPHARVHDHSGNNPDPFGRVPMDASKSYLRQNVVLHAYDASIGALSTSGLEVSHNVAYDGYKTGIQCLSGSGNTITHNLVAWTKNSHPSGRAHSLFTLARIIRST